MPEGDTLHRLAHQIGLQLGGKRILAARGRADLSGIADLAGQALHSARAQGKHLLLATDGGLSVHSHLGMTGSWHIYPHGEPWRKPPRRAALALRFDRQDLVCFSPKLIELQTVRRLRHHAQLIRLGPDLLKEDFSEADACTAIARLRGHGHTPLGEALMNQRLVAGIGNVYKSEILFLARLDPFATVASVEDQTLFDCLYLARQHMRRNLEGLRRKFRGSTLGDRLWVYRRRGLPCLECGTPIEMRRQGDTARSTYFCRRCQGVRS